MQFFTAFVLGLLTILDPCTLMTSITAIGFIDKEINNRRKVLTNGLMFVLGKLATYILLSIPFMMGAQTEKIQHILGHWGEPILAGFMLICGIVLLISGHHHEHDHECHDPDCCCHEHHHEHHHHADEVFTSWGLETVKKFTKEQLEVALTEIQKEEKYGNVLRAKGILASEGKWLHFDYVPGEPQIREGSAGVIGRLCVIGCNLNETALKELFKA